MYVDISKNYDFSYQYRGFIGWVEMLCCGNTQTGIHNKISRQRLGRIPGNLFKHITEVRHGVKSALICNVSNLPVGKLQQLPCVFDLHLVEVFDQCHLHGALEHPAQVVLGHKKGFRDLPNIRPIHARVTLDDGLVVEDDYIFGAICNSTSVGGIMTLDPNQVDLKDGKFEVLLVRAPKNWQEISECLLALQTQQYNSAMMTFCSASYITVEAEPDMVWTLDGEKEPGHAQIEIRNLQKKISIIR